MRSLFLHIVVVAFVCSCAKPSGSNSEGQNANPPGAKPLPNLPYNPNLPPEDYSPRGIGGGGAMSALSISPYASLVFVGTDMGTLFRSVDGGASWHAVDQRQTSFSSDLSSAAYVGFSADPNIVFHAVGGTNPKRSTDQGVTWSPMALTLLSGEKIKYWIPDSTNPDVIFCATTQRLLRTQDRGLSWVASSGIAGAPFGTFIDYATSTVYHALQTGILASTDGGSSFVQAFAAPGSGLRAFAGGRDSNGITLAFIDRDGANACAWASTKPGVTPAQITGTQNDCGYVWVKRGAAAFARTNQEGGRYVRMAENDSTTLYVTGGSWMRQYGSKTWVSRDSGQTWNLRFHIYNWDVNPYAPWPSDLLEHSPPGLEIGWDDNAFESFSVNPRNSAMVGGTGYYFLHVSRDYGNHWQAPFTNFADAGARVKGKVWRSTGLEVTSVLRLKFHPGDPSLAYASLADMAGLVTEDGGETYRVTKAMYNTNYDYAFDPSNTNRVYAVSGAEHDWPEGWHGNVTVGNGGVHRSDNRGRTWTRLTAAGGAFDRQFLSLAYDASRNTLYAGSQGAGVARSTDGGATWAYYNAGFPSGGLIIPQIELDPLNGNVYALLTGDAPTWSNSAQTGIYYLDVAGGSSTWVLLRGTVVRPSGVSSTYALHQYPTAFAVDWTRAQRDTFWLVDSEKNGQWLATGAWKTTDRGTTWTRSTQFTHPVSVTIDPQDPNRVYLGGSWAVDGSWGKGGAYYTTDGGVSWKKNTTLPLAANLRATTLDPNNPGALFYLFFGGGMLYGPRPE